MISIIGGGPAGCYLGYLLAKHGEKVRLFEEHEQIGVPIHCTGIVTSEIKKIINLRKRFVLNNVREFRIFSPDGNFVELKLRNADIILDRAEFDKYMAEKAESEGVKINLNKKFLGYKEDNPFRTTFLGKTLTKNSVNGKENNKLKLIFKGGSAESDILVGADGGLSSVGKAAGLFKRNFIIGVQARVSLKNENRVEIFLNKDYFGWIVPENKEVVRAGIIAKQNSNFHFKNFLKKRIGKAKIREYQGGAIPVYNSKEKRQKGNKIFLIGDAAGFVKASSYGGIVQGLKSAEEMYKAIISKKFDYEERWRKRIGRELGYSLQIRNLLNRFKDSDYNELIRLVNQKRIKNVLERYDRDNPKRVLFKLLFLEPRFLKFLF